MAKTPAVDCGLAAAPLLNEFKGFYSYSYLLIRLPPINNIAKGC
jgi:hypothetical protein